MISHSFPPLFISQSTHKGTPLEIARNSKDSVPVSTLQENHLSFPAASAEHSPSWPGAAGCCHRVPGRWCGRRVSAGPWRSPGGPSAPQCAEPCRPCGCSRSPRSRTPAAAVSSVPERAGATSRRDKAVVRTNSWALTPCKSHGKQSRGRGGRLSLDTVGWQMPAELFQALGFLCLFPQN